MLNIYIVGPLFTEAEAKQRRYEGQRIREILEKNQVEYELSNPIDMPASNQQDVTSSEIYQADYERLSKADVVFFDLSNEDSGSCVALGLIMEKKLQGKEIRVYPVFHDIRLLRNGMSGLESSCGFNSMVVGILKGNDITIYSSFEEAFLQFCLDQKLDQLELAELPTVDVQTAFECYAQFDKVENGFENSAYGLSIEQFKEYVKRCEKNSKGIDLPDWKVPDTAYLLMDGNQAVGIFKLRHYLNDALKNGAGHIGYGIAKQYRGKGYGTKGLKLLLDKCREYGMDEVLLSVCKENTASLKVQLANGANIIREDDRHYYTSIQL